MPSPESDVVSESTPEVFGPSTVEETPAEAEAPHVEGQGPDEAKNLESEESEPAAAENDAEAKIEAPASPAQKGRASGSNSLRVDGLRLDRLIDLIGELVITETMVSGAAGSVDGAADDEAQEWNHHLGRLGKITRAIHEIAGSLRIVPVTSTFSKMARLARDVSKKAGKPVNVQVTGEDTELDKTLVDKIGDPLVHMIRNSVDHGLESSGEDRIAAGKPEVGRVDLRAFHKEGNIHIQVQDDGKGLARDAILEKAIGKGLLKSGENISDRDICRLICEPGFSTAAAVTEISGRGVGMDVVKKAIEDMGGRLEIHSERGVGTTMTLQLPLTLAVIDGMVVTVGQNRYIVPTLSVVRLVTPEDGQITTLLGREEMIKVHGELIPVVRLGDLFDDSIIGKTEAVAIIAEAEGVRISLMVDEVLDQQQVVIKSLDEVSQSSGLSGCAIMPDGSVGLVLDVGGLVDRYGRANQVLAKASAG